MRVYCIALAVNAEAVAAYLAQQIAHGADAG
jgi:hypothetical protein